MIKWNTELVKERIEKCGEYKLIGEYKAPNKINVYHVKCGKDYFVSLQHFLNGTRCSHCFRPTKKSNEQFLDEVENKYPNNEYKFLEKYKANFIKLKVEHKCGFVYEVSPKNFLTNNRKCPKCSGVPRKDTKYFLNEIQEKYGKEIFDDIEILSEYKKYNVNIDIKCLKCNIIFKRTPDNILRQGYHCSKCKGSVSKPIQDIIEVLNKNNIVFELEKRFPECKRTYTLPFDIFLVKYNILIEYDGEQHYVGFNRSVESLKYIQENDNIKNTFAKEQNMPLYRIAYNENHIEEIQKILKEVQRLS